MLEKIEAIFWLMMATSSLIYGSVAIANKHYGLGITLMAAVGAFVVLSKAKEW